MASLTAEIRAAAQGIQPTFFEFTTAMALLYFARQKVDLVVLEVGMGGRLDATNVVDPALSIITPVAFDHSAYLGDSLSDIATEKGGLSNGMFRWYWGPRLRKWNNVCARWPPANTPPAIAIPLTTAWRG